MTSMIKQSSAELTGLLSVNWVNFLPPFEGKNIIKFGTNKIETIISFSKRNCKSLVCIGPQRSDFFSSPVTYHQNLQCLEQNKYDLCIIDEIDFFYDINSLHELREKIDGIFNLLNSKGLMLIAPPHGLHFIKYRFAIQKMASDAGFRNIDTLFCAPSFHEPLTVYPFSKDKELTFKILFYNYFKERALKLLIKSAFKYFLVKISPLFNPFFNPVFIARKSLEVDEVPKAEKLVSCNYHKESLVVDKIYSIWFDKPSGQRQIGLMYYGEKHNKKLLAVCKQSNFEHEGPNYTKQEYDKLILLSEYNETFKSSGIFIPQPICFEVNSGKSLFIESALPGRPLREYNQKPNDKIDVNYLNRLDNLVDIQIFIQNLLSNGIKHRLPEIPATYFENSIHFPYASLNNINRIFLYKDYVQHGDFTDINIIYNDAENTWGIIDWEWLASGFPPLFDLFYLFTSLEYRNSKKKNGLFLEHHVSSFIETFFQDNSYSTFVKNAILKYCKRFNLNDKQTFDYLLDFLLFHFNKYRLANVTEYTELYKNLLIFSIKNKERYIVRQQHKQFFS